MSALSDRVSRSLFSLGEMLRFYARPFLEADRLLTQLTVLFRSSDVDKFAPDARDNIAEMLRDLIEQLSSMELRMSRVSAERLLARLPRIDIPSELKKPVDELYVRLRDDIETIFLMRLSEAERQIYESQNLFGTKVQTEFPSVAGKFGDLPLVGIPATTARKQDAQHDYRQSHIRPFLPMLGHNRQERLTHLLEIS